MTRDFLEPLGSAGFAGVCRVSYPVRLLHFANSQPDLEIAFSRARSGVRNPANTCKPCTCAHWCRLGGIHEIVHGTDPIFTGSQDQCPLAAANRLVDMSFEPVPDGFRRRHKACRRMAEQEIS